MDQMFATRIRSYIRAHRDEIARDICRLAAIPSVRSEAEPDAPFGKACRDALTDAVALFRENGFAAECRSGNRYGIATYGEGEPTVAFFAHTDVVPVGDDWELTEPFLPIVTEDGYLIGRGVEDNKAGVVTSLYVLRAFRDLSLPLKGRLMVFLGAAEETGMEDVAAFCAETPMPTVSLVPDCAYPVGLGEKGICHLKAKSNTPFRQITRFSGGAAYNIVLDRAEVRISGDDALLRELETLAREREEVSIAFVEDGRASLTFTGLAAHACDPHKGINAARLACELLGAVSRLDADDRRILRDTAALLSTVNGESFGIASEDAYFGRVTAANGIVELIDGALALTFDIRYGTSSDPDVLLSSVQRALDVHGFSPIFVNNRPGFRLSENEPAARALLSAYRLLSGDASAKPFYSGGGTYARYLKNAYSIGCNVPYIKGTRVFSPGHGEAHQSDESLCLDSHLESVSVTVAMTVALEECL